MKLAIAQMVLGVLIVGSLLWFSVWVEPGFYHVEIPGRVIFFNPGWNIPMRIWEAVSLVLGLLVLGCGVAQYLKVRGKRTGRNGVS